MANILYVTDVFPPHCGGSGWSVYFFARALRAGGHTVQIFALDGPSRQYDGFNVHSIPLTKSETPFIGNWLRENRDLPKIAAALKPFIENSEILHAHHRFSAVALAQAEPSRFFVTIRDYWPICFCSRSIYRTGVSCNLHDFARCSEADNTLKGIAAPLVYPWFEARLSRWNALIRRAEKIFCISNYLKTQLEPVFDEKKFVVLPNFAEELPSTRRLDLPERFVLFTGRLEKNKGAHLLPEIIEKSGIKIPLVIVGDGALHQELVLAFKAKSIDVRFMGYLEYPEMLSVLRQSEFVLFPSIWSEPLGRVLIEASMLGKPSLTFDHPGGHHDVIEHEHSGLMANSIDDYARNVNLLANDSSLRNTLGQNARKVYESRFSPQIVIPKLLQLYS
jgi:glycosyltransferase involved in cell wall biosynthesis